jgi:hypothetical protein
MQLSNFKDLPRSSRNLSRKMTLRHGKTHQQSLFTGSYLTGPSSTSREICDTSKKTSQAFQGHENQRKSTLRAMSTICGKINESKEIMLEIQHVFSFRGITFARRVFLAYCDLIRKFRTLRENTRSPTMCNSRISKIFPG